MNFPTAYKLLSILGILALATGEFSCGKFSSGAYPDPGNCNSFYACSGGIPYRLGCSKGRFFDSLTYRCTSASEAVCPYTEDDPDSPENTVDSMENDWKPSQESVSWGDEQFLGSQCRELTEGSTFSTLENCNRYYVCLQGSAFEMNCKDGLYFNLITQTCHTLDDIPYESPCLKMAASYQMNKANRSAILSEGLASNDSSETLCEYNPDKCDPHKDISFPDPENVTRFYQCSYGYVCKMNCDKNEIFDPIRSGCYDEENSETGREADKILDERNDYKIIFLASTLKPCEYDNISCDPNEADSAFPDEEDNCTSFYTCSYGVKCHLQCPEGLVFDPVTMQCDYPNDQTNPSCLNTTTFTTTKRTTLMTTEMTTMESTTTTEPSTTTTEPSTTTTEPSTTTTEPSTTTTEPSTTTTEPSTTTTEPSTTTTEPSTTTTEPSTTTTEPSTTTTEPSTTTTEPSTTTTEPSTTTTEPSTTTTESSTTTTEPSTTTTEPSTATTEPSTTTTESSTTTTEPSTTTTEPFTATTEPSSTTKPPTTTLTSTTIEPPTTTEPPTTNTEYASTTNPPLSTTKTSPVSTITTVIVSTTTTPHTTSAPDDSTKKPISEATSTWPCSGPKCTPIPATDSTMQPTSPFPESSGGGSREFLFIFLIIFFSLLILVAICSLLYMKHKWRRNKLRYY